MSRLKTVHVMVADGVVEDVSVPRGITVVVEAYNYGKRTTTVWVHKPSRLPRDLYGQRLFQFAEVEP